MTKKLLTIAFIFISFSVFAQKLKKKIEKHKDAYYTEIYHVLKHDKKIKHGPYKQVTSSGQLLEEGQYENNEKVGVWKFYSQGKLEQEYNYTTSEVEFRKPIHKRVFTYYTIQNGQRKEIVPDKVPVFIGGDSRVLRSTGTMLKYPEEAQRKGISGVVQISITITKDGKMINEHVTSGIGGGCDEEALRVLKLVPDEWVPAEVNGKPISVTFNYPYIFKLWDN